MTSAFDLDPRYIIARRILLDALVALENHRDAVILVGAQAVYLRTQLTEVAESIAPFTTDGDLALDPTALLAVPQLESAMEGAGFHLFQNPSGGIEPGMWVADEVLDGKDFKVPVDLIVPEAASDGEGRRGARLGPHGNRAARKAVGLEAALVDNAPEVIAALDPADDRSVVVKVAGVAALLVAKSHKIHDRVASGRVDRLSDKDASDVYRIMQTSRPVDVATTMRMLLENELCGPVTRQALLYMSDLLGRPAGEGVAMAHRALQGVIDPATVEVVSTTYVGRLLDEIA
jgi:hypothetical protein